VGGIIYATHFVRRLFAFRFLVASCQLFPVASALAFSLLFFNLFAFACPAYNIYMIKWLLELFK